MNQHDVREDDDMHSQQAIDRDHDYRSMKTRIGFVAVGLIFLAFVALYISTAHAQDTPPEPIPEVVRGTVIPMEWVQEPVCADGVTPIAQCPVTGYHVQIQRTALSTDWFNVGTNPFGPIARSYRWASNGSGITCFRVIALSDVNSDPSNVKCWKIVDPPKQAPKAPVLQ